MRALLPWRAGGALAARETNMHVPDQQTFVLPLQAVANAVYPYDTRLAGARRFLAERGITAVRPVYGRPPSRIAAAPAGARARGCTAA